MKLVMFRFVAMKNLLLVAVAISMLSSCSASAPKIVAEAAERDLHRKCSVIFLDGRRYRYQQYATMPFMGKAVLALADDPQYGQFCAWASNNYTDVKVKSFENATWEQLEFVAIGRCETSKPEYVKTPCKIYARNNDIVWHDKKKIGLD